MNLDAIQSALRDQHLDGWLFYDHHHRDPIAYRILGLPDSFVSRRWYYFVPAHGEPRKLVHRIESGKLDRLPGATRQYSSWQELEQNLAGMLEGSTKIAMQYSPRNAIMYVAMVDAGTVELLRSLGKDIVTSADLVSLFEAVLTEDQIATHYAAQERLDRVLAAGWKFITDRTRPGDHTSEFEIITFFLQAMEREGLWTDHGPNCSVGPNSADSHYEPTELRAAPIFHGDFVLIDIWAKLSEPHDTPRPPRRRLVRHHLDRCRRPRTHRPRAPHLHHRPHRARRRHRRRRAGLRRQPAHPRLAGRRRRPQRHPQGWTRRILYASHRPQHCHELHGNGAHLDNLETHDERLLLPNTCFSVEPGLYFPGEFGVRSEVNMITRPGKAVVTGPRQTELLRI